MAILRRGRRCGAALLEWGWRRRGNRHIAPGRRSFRRPVGLGRRLAVARTTTGAPGCSSPVGGRSAHPGGTARAGRRSLVVLVGVGEFCDPFAIARDDALIIAAAFPAGDDPIVLVRVRALLSDWDSPFISRLNTAFSRSSSRPSSGSAQISFSSAKWAYRQLKLCACAAPAQTAAARNTPTPIERLMVLPANACSSRQHRAARQVAGLAGLAKQPQQESRRTRRDDRRKQNRRGVNRDSVVSAKIAGQ